MGFGPGLGHIWPISRVLGLDLSLIWALSGGPGSLVGPISSLNRPIWVIWNWILAISGVLDLDLGHFWCSRPGFGPFPEALGLDLGLSRPTLSLNRLIREIWDRIWAFTGVLGLDSGYFRGGVLILV